MSYKNPDQKACHPPKTTKGLCTMWAVRALLDRGMDARDMSLELKTPVKNIQGLISYYKRCAPELFPEDPCSVCGERHSPRVSEEYHKELIRKLRGSQHLTVAI